jgi:hypothetical protein
MSLKALFLAVLLVVAGPMAVHASVAQEKIYKVRYGLSLQQKGIN